MRLFDPQCYALACHFLDDCKGVTEGKRNDLASTIQQAIEDWGVDDLNSEDSYYDKHIDSLIDQRREA
jgi:hypothetical protein